jgi:hypothetical protein
LWPEDLEVLAPQVSILSFLALVVVKPSLGHVVQVEFRLFKNSRSLRKQFAPILPQVHEWLVTSVTAALRGLL